MTKKKVKKQTQHSKAKLDKAKALYLEYSTQTDITKQTGIPRSTLVYHIRKDNGWEYERNLARAELLSHVASAKKADFAKMTGSTITVLKRALSSLAIREEAPTVQEAKGAASILEVLDKITRLDDDKPTDIIQSDKPVTVVELKSKLKLDPFAGNVEEIEYEETDK
jgi:hypothetical protein